MSGRYPTTYYLRWGWRLWAALCLGLAVVGLGLLIGLILAVSKAPPSGARGLLILAALGTGLGVYCLSNYALNLLTIRLVISARGLDYHQRWTHTGILWHDIRSRCVVKWHRRWLYEGVWVQPSSAAPQRIPLALFDAAWPQGTLAATLRLCAPHVFAGPKAPRRRRNRRAPQAPAPVLPTPPVARPAITRRLRPLRPSGNAVPGEWQGDVTGRLADHDGDTVRF